MFTVSDKSIHFFTKYFSDKKNNLKNADVPACFCLTFILFITFNLFSVESKSTFVRKSSMIKKNLKTSNVLTEKFNHKTFIETFQSTMMTHCAERPDYV